MKQKKGEKVEYLSENAVLMCSSELYETPFVVGIEFTNLSFYFSDLTVFFLLRTIERKEFFESFFFVIFFFSLPPVLFCVRKKFHYIQARIRLRSVQH